MLTYITHNLKINIQFSWIFFMYDKIIIKLVFDFNNENYCEK